MNSEPISELVSLIQKNDKHANRQFFEHYYGTLAPVALRYSKNQGQANEVFHTALHNTLTKIRHARIAEIEDLDQYIQKQFIAECVSFIRGIRSEYYVASTVYASETQAKTYDLFANTELIDYKNIDSSVLIKALHLLVPSQRLIFNLHVVDGYSMADAALLLESSEATAKSNLEKARFNLQKNVEKCLNAVKYEQSF